jgi:hypothetical protein
MDGLLQSPIFYANLIVIGAGDPPEYSWLYSIPAVVFTGGFLAAAHTGMEGLVQAGYLTSSILCIGPSFAPPHLDF